MKKLTLSLLSTLLLTTSCIAGIFASKTEFSHQILNSTNIVKKLNKVIEPNQGIVIHAKWWGYQIGFTHNEYLNGLSQCINDLDFLLTFTVPIASIGALPIIDGAIALNFILFTDYYTAGYNVVGLNFIWPWIPNSFFCEK